MLRSYQQKMYDKTSQSFSNGHKRPLLVAPCGAGKSYIFCEMIKNCKGDVLVLTHRQELKSQHEALFAEQGIANARVAMIMTEANRLGQYPTPRMIITDEAHLSRSNSWVKVINYYDTFTIGFTATPVRLDGKPLGDIYDDLIVGVDTQYLIDSNHLAPFKYYAPTIVDTEDLPKSGGDYTVLTMEELMCNRAVYSDALASWRKLADGQKTIAYCVSVKHAEQVAEEFNKAGIPSIAISSKTPLNERMEIMDAFRRGDFTVLCNVGIISEGVSINDVTCCLLLRPTESLALYWQQAMRCMRYLPDKTAIIIDCVGNYTRNPIVGSPVHWSLDKAPHKPSRHNDDGSFTIRTCPECYMTFKTSDICPFCGEPYPLHSRELKMRQEIELKEIKAADAERVAEEKKKLRQEVGRARTYPELAKIAKERGYSQGWIFHMMRSRGH